MMEVALICISITTSFTLMTDTEKISALHGAHPCHRNSHWSPPHGGCGYLRVVLDMLMRLLLAALHPGSPGPGKPQIETNLCPGPPKSMPRGMRNEDVTGMPWDPRRHCNFWHSPCTYNFVFSGERGYKRRHQVHPAPALQQHVLRTSACCPPRSS